jgi:hypothetical protein
VSTQPVSSEQSAPTAGGDGPTNTSHES